MNVKKHLFFVYVYTRHLFLTYVFIYIYVYTSNVYMKILVYVKNGILY